MKKALSLFLCVLFAFGCLFGCSKKSDDSDASTGSAKELISKVRYTTSINRNGELSENEMVMNFTWSNDGAIMEGYEQLTNSRNEVRIEATYDDQKRPLSIIKTSQNDGKTASASTTFSYPGDLQINILSTHYDGFSQEISQTYDENGRILTAVYPDYTRSYEYDSHGNCVRQQMQYTDESMTDWESTTTYSYDDEGKIILAIKTRPDQNLEEQQHYYYYPNGNVRAILYVNSNGDVNYAIRPYNTNDFLAWSYGMQVSGAFTCQAEKNEQGLITKVTRKYEHSDEVQTATFSYDSRGNLVHEVRFNGTIYTREYDELNRMTMVIENRCTSSDKTVYTTTYEYDDLGRLIAERRNGTNGNSEIQTMTYNEAGMVTERYSKNIIVENGETYISERKMEIEYVDNDKCPVNHTFRDFFLKTMING